MNARLVPPGLALTAFALFCLAAGCDSRATLRQRVVVTESGMSRLRITYPDCPGQEDSFSLEPENAHRGASDTLRACLAKLSSGSPAEARITIFGGDAWWQRGPGHRVESVDDCNLAVEDLNGGGSVGCASWWSQ